MSYPTIERLREDIGKRMHDFYRCYKCNRLITREKEREIWDDAGAGMIPEAKVAICRCGGAKYSPALPVDEEWQRPDVLRYTLKMILARAVAPWLEEHEPEGLEHLEWLLNSKAFAEKAELAWPLVKSIIDDIERFTVEKETR